MQQLKNEKVAADQSKDAIKPTTSQSSAFDIVKEQMNEFNYFILNNDITIKNKNVLGAIKDIIHFLLIRPVLKYDESSKTFSLEKVHESGQLLSKFKRHIPIFQSFDKNKVNKEHWGVNMLTDDNVVIIVKVEPADSGSIINKFKLSVKDAVLAGWKGNLKIISRVKEASTVVP